MAKTFSVAVEIGGRINPSLPRSIRKTEGLVAAMGRRIAGMNAGVASAVSSAGRGVSAVGRSIQDAGRSVTANVSAPLGLLGMGAGKMAFEFEKAGNALEALGDATSDQRAEFEKYANELNKKYPQSLAGIISTGNEMLKGGFNFDQMKGALDQTLATAVLGDMAPAEVGNMMARTINAFQLPMKTYADSMRSSQRVSDQMTYAAVKTTASLKDMGEAYRYIGGAASAAGIPLESATALTMAMAKNGSVGSDAGVALRSAIVRMVKMPAKGLAAMERIGMKLGDYQGGARKVTAGNVVAGLSADGIDASPVQAQIGKALENKALAGSPVKLAAAITKIVQAGVKGAGEGALDSKTLAENVQSSIVAAGSKIDIVKFFGDLKKKFETGQAGLGDLATILEGRHASRYMPVLQSDLLGLIDQVTKESDGYAQARYKIMLKGIVGAVYEISAAMEKLSVSLGRAGFPTIAQGLGYVTDAINAAADASPRLLKFGVATGLAAIALGPFLMAAGATVRVVGMLARALGLLATAATFGLASKLVMISAAIRGFAAAQVAVAVASIMRLRTALVGLMLLGAVGGRGAVFGALALGARALIPALLALLNPVRLVVSALKLLRFAIIGTGVGALLVGLAAAGTAIYNNWTSITKAFTTFKAGLSKALGPEAQGMLAPVVGLFERIGKAWSDLTGKQSEGKLMMWGYSLGRSLGEALNSLKALKPAFDLVASGWDALKAHFTSGGGDLFANTAREFESVKSVFTGIVDLAGRAKAAIEQIPEGFATLQAKAQEAWNGVKSLDWAGLGAQIVSAIAAGITSGASALVGALKGAAQSAWNSAKGVFGGGGGGGAGGAAPAPGGAPLAGARALGGPVRSGLPYLVGERGPEIFVPGATGRIETNGALRNLSAAGRVTAASPLRSPSAGDMVRAGVGEGTAGSKSVRGGDTSIVNNWTINGATDPEGVRRQVDARFRALIAQMESEQRGLLSD